ncbi:uncharacterized protein METZ01_LOCUS227280 [marine metagenome]|uniref:Uncharacterized protein n=1 Tax=marine metagenome TaxID=408172 RepID=A0A382GGT7_9ZZZZ
MAGKNQEEKMRQDPPVSLSKGETAINPL